MDCIEVEAHLPLFVGGDLEAPLAVEVGGHLEACEGCQGRLEAARRARSALLGLAELGPVPADLDLWPGVRAGLVREGLVGSPSGIETAAVARPGAHRRDARPGDGGSRLRLVRTLGTAAAAAALALFAWRPWMAAGPAGAPQAPGTADGAPTPPVAGLATNLAPRVPTGLELGGTGDAGEPLGTALVSTGPGTLWPAAGSTSVPLIPASTRPGGGAWGGLQRVTPGEELLRDRARLYPEGSTPTWIVPVHATGRGQGGLSLVSDGVLR